MSGLQVLVLVLIVAAFATGWSARGRAEREKTQATPEPREPAPEAAPAPSRRPPELVALATAVSAWDRARRDTEGAAAFAAAAADVDAYAERLDSGDYEDAANALAGLHHLLRDRDRLASAAAQAALARHQRALTDAYVRVAAP
jgi:hypothetical protein